MGDPMGMYLVLVLGLVAYTSAQLTEITNAGCGTTKGCFLDPPSCDSSKNCDYLVTFSRDGDKFVFEMSGKMKWVAVGFNGKGSSMPGTDAVLCVNSGTVVIQHYDLTGYSSLVKTNPLPSEISLTESGSDGDKILCKFSRKITGSGKLKSLSKNHFLVYAYGDVNAGLLQKHTYKKTSENPVNLESYTNVKAKEQDLSLIKAHGSLMAIAWMGFVSIAIFMAMNMKQMWEDQKLFGQKVWFSVHRGLNTLAVLFSVIGVILVFVYRKGWSEGIGAHPYTGIITVFLAIINPIMALFRPHPGEPKRFIFNWAHRIVGLSAMILAVVSLFLAVFLEQLNIKKAGLPVVIIFVVGIAIMVIFQIYQKYFNSATSRQDYTTSDSRGNVEQMQPDQPALQPKEEKIRYFLFGFVMVINVATTLALVIIVATMKGQ